MKLLLIPALLFAVHGCAKDNYAVIPNGPGSPARMNTDLASCKDAVLHQYAAHQPPIGAFAAGGVGGVLLGAATGLLGARTGSPMSPKDIDPAIERCMVSKGYSGTSEN